MRTCLIKTKENMNAVESLAEKLSAGDSSQLEKYRKVAYFLLANNNALDPSKDRNGNTSVLYQQLKAEYGTDQLAMLAKAYIYTTDFLKKHGDWIEDNKPEPTLAEVKDHGKLVEKFFPNSNSSAISEEINNLLCNSALAQFSEGLVAEYLEEDIQSFIDEQIKTPESLQQIEDLYNSMVQLLPAEEKTNDKLEDIRKKAIWKIKDSIRVDYATKKVNQIVKSVYDSYFKLWGMDKFWNKSKNDFNDVYDETDIDQLKDNDELKTIVQFRINFLRMLSKPIQTQEDYNFVETVVREVLTGNGKVTILPRIVDVYFDLYKHTDVIINMLKQTGLIEERSGKPTAASLSRAEQKLKQAIIKELNDFEKTDGKFSKFMHKLALNTKIIIQGLSNWSFLGSLFVSSGVATTMSFTGHDWLTTSLVSSGIVASSLVFKFVVSKTLGDKIQIDETNRNNARKILMASAINKNLETVNTSNDNMFDLFREIMSPYKAKSSHRVLYYIRQVLNSQRSALRSVSQQNSYNSQKNRDLQSIEQMIRYCDTALRSISQEDDSMKVNINIFFHKYYNDYMIDSIAQAISTLREMKDNPETIDVKELMRIKTDVIGAFYNAINNIITPEKEGLYEEGLDYNPRQVLDNVISKDLNTARQLLGQVIDTWCKNYIDDFVNDYCKNSVKRDKRESFKKNLYSWLSSEFVSGDPSFVQETILSAKDSSSPLISMLVQKMEEIDQEVQSKSDEIGEKMMELFDKTKGNIFKQMFNWKNILNNFCERDDEGKFTGFFKNPIKIGLYLKHREQVRQRLIKKHGIHTNKSGNTEFKGDYSNDPEYVYKYVIETENGIEETQFQVKNDVDNNTNSGQNMHQITRWQAFQMDLQLWQAGGEFQEDGTILLKKNSVARVHQRKDYRYYMIKFKYLNQEDCQYLSELNQKIAKLNQKCIDTIDVDGKIVKFPNVAKLSARDRDTLRQLINEKNQLDCMQVFIPRVDGNTISEIKDKTNEVEKNRSFRFLQFNQAVKEIESKASKDRDEQIVKLSSEISSLKRKLYNARHEDRKSIQDQIDDKQKQLKDSFPINRTFDKVVERYDNQINDLSQKIQQSNDPVEKQQLTEQLNTLVQAKNVFIVSNSRIGLNRELSRFLKKEKTFKFDILNQALVSYVQATRTLYLLKNQLRSNDDKRSLDLRLVESTDDVKTKQTWYQIIKLCQKIEDYKYAIKDLLEEYENEGESAEDLFERTDVMLLDNDFNETQTTFTSYLQDRYGFTEDELKIDNHYTGYRQYPSIFKKSQPKEGVYLEYEDEDGNPIFQSNDDLFEQIPTGIFSDNKSAFSNNEFDEESEEYVQINKNRHEYNNSSEYNKIENDELYKFMLQVMDEAYKLMPGITRRSKYTMPQIQASVSEMYSRSFTQKKGWKTAYKNIVRSFRRLGSFETTDVDVNEDLMYKSDGTIVELIPTRFVSTLSDVNEISTDLINSVLNFYLEALRYNRRSQMQYAMDAFLFKLSGGFTRAQDANRSNQVNMLKSEISKSIYGRDLIGSGENGRMLRSEQRLAALSKRIRSLLHERLMGNNDLSCMKNAFDSFCNIWTLGYDQKFFTTTNVISGIGKILSNFPNALFSVYSAKACCFTQGLLHKNGVDKTADSRFKNQNKFRIRRFLDECANMWFELIDYTAKSIITEAIYDNYRVLWNPLLQTFSIMNHAEAMRVYSTYKEGHDAWSDAKGYTLRSLYKFDKSSRQIVISDKEIELTYMNHDGNGKKFKFKPIDLIKPNGSKMLETSVKAEIRHICNYANGMLAKEDKATLARHWLGAMFTAYRGWMITQFGLNCRDGQDFYQTLDKMYDPNTIKKFSDTLSYLFRQDKTGYMDDVDYKGKFDPASKDIGSGYFRNQWTTMAKNWKTSLVMMIVPFSGFISKLRYQQSISRDDMQKICHFAANVQWMMATVLLTALAYSLAYGDGDGDDDDENAEWYEVPRYIKVKIYAALIASLSERFTTLGKMPFYVNLSDITKSISVATTLMDDAKFIWESVNTIGDLFGENQYDETDSGQMLINGSFQGCSKGERNVTRALALTGVNLLPSLFLLDGLNEVGLLPSEFEDVKFRDYCLNYRKYHNIKSTESSIKFYKELFPTPWISKGANSVGLQIDKQKEDSSYVGE